MDRESIQRSFVQTDEGQIHYRVAGTVKKVVLLLHQTPRSSDEFRDVIPKLAKHMTVIAMDSPGYGDSYKPQREFSIEDYRDVVIRLLDQLKVKKVSVIGHHTGALIAFELAATHGERIEKLVLSACSYFDKSKRDSRKRLPSIDEIESKEDGSHLLELWNRRSKFYPKDRPDLLQRYIIDALKAGNYIESGHHACQNYRMEDKIHLIKSPTLLVCGTDDQFAFPDQRILQGKIKGSEFASIPNGMVPLPDQMPEKFVEAILPFLLREE